MKKQEDDLQWAVEQAPWWARHARFIPVRVVVFLLRRIPDEQGNREQQEGTA